MSFPGVLHNYTGNLVAFELAPVSSSKVIVFMGGLGDGLLTVPYIHNVARELAPLGWSVIQIQMTSSFKGWGISSLDQDVREMRALVDYLRSEQGGARERIVLFGHSTGSVSYTHLDVYKRQHYFYSADPVRRPSQAESPRLVRTTTLRIRL